MQTSLSPRLEAAIARLERAARNEDVHTRHVTALAVQLFDGVREAFGFTADQRRLLEIASRLHDIGYAAAPLDHVRAGAQRVLRARLPDLDVAARRSVAAVILLHSGRDHRTALRDPLLAAGPARDQALPLGAILRVADGLDNGHVQDARIIRIKVGRRRVRVDLHSPAWPRNALTAARKAGLWTDALPRPLLLRVSGRGRPRLVRRTLAAREAARRLLNLEYRGFMAALEGARAGEAEGIHDARVALRRCRALLRAFAGARPSVGARRAGTELRRLADALGAARDFDVWEKLMADEPRPRGWAAAARGARRAAGGALEGESLDRLRRAMGLLLRIELATAAAGNASAGRSARAAFRQAVRAAGRCAAGAPASAQAAHRLRRRLRRVVLLGDVLGRLLPRRALESLRPLRRAERALGRLHDVESLLAFAPDSARRARLSRELAARRAKALRRLRRPSLARALHRLA